MTPMSNGPNVTDFTRENTHLDSSSIGTQAFPLNVHFGQAAMTEPPMLTVVPRFVSKPGVTTGTQSVQVAVIWHASAAGRQEMVPISASASLARMCMSPMVVEVEGAMAWSLPPPSTFLSSPHASSSTALDPNGRAGFAVPHDRPPAQLCGSANVKRFCGPFRSPSIVSSTSRVMSPVGYSPVKHALQNFSRRGLPRRTAAFIASRSRYMR